MIIVGQILVRSARFGAHIRPESKEEDLDERRWHTAFAGSQEALAKLAQRARNHYEAGNTEPLDPNNL